MTDVADFLKCPSCHRSGTVELALHLDGDISIECVACGEVAVGNKLHQSARTYD